MVVWAFWWWARTWWSGRSGGGHTPQGGAAFLLYPSGALLITSRKFLKMSQWAWCGESWWSHIPPPKASAQLPCLRDTGVFRKLKPCLRRVSLGPPRSLIKMREFPKQNPWSQSLLNSRIFISFSRQMFETITHSGLGKFVTTAHPSLELYSPCYVLKVSQSILFCRLNNPNSLSLSSLERCSIPLIIFVALLWTRSNRSMSCIVGCRAGCSTPGGISQKQTKWGESLPSAV